MAQPGQELFNPRSNAALTDYAVRTRYPDDYQPVDRKQFERAIALASRIVSWAESVVQP
jgi:hypothetical protein